MEYITSIYPPLDQRYPLPGWYLLLGLLATTAAPLTTNRLIRHSIVFPLLVVLAVGSPAFTQGNVTDDYGRPFLLLHIAWSYLDFGILSPADGERIAFEGYRPTGSASMATGEYDCTTTHEKSKWSLRLLTTARGIGWTWQVKGIPTHPDADMERHKFVAKYSALSAWSWACRWLTSYFIGVGAEARSRATSIWIGLVGDTVLGWSGAFQSYYGINGAYYMAAALTVGVHLCDPWEWPPMFGPLSEAWSVRQMWR
jgi:hypothetical protein